MTETLSRIHWFDKLLFFALISGPPRFRIRDVLATYYGVLDWNTLLDMVVWGIAGLWLVHHWFSTRPHGTRKLPKLSVIHWLSLYFAVQLFIGIGWSFPILLREYNASLTAIALAVYQSFQVIIMIFFGYFWVDKYGVERTLDSLRNSAIALSMILLITYVIQPEMVALPIEIGGALLRLKGSAYGGTEFIASVGIITTIARPPKSRLWNIILLVGFTVLIVASWTRMAYVVLGATLILAAIFRLPESRLARQYMNSLWVGAIGLVLFNTAWLVDYLSRSDSFFESYFVRVRAWEHFIDILLREAPLFGLGMRTDRIFTHWVGFQRGMVGSTHNAYISVLLSTGIIGIVIYLLIMAVMVYMLWLLAWRYAFDNITFALAALLAASLIYSFTVDETILTGVIGFSNFLLFSLIPYYYRQKQQEAQDIQNEGQDT